MYLKNELYGLIRTDESIFEFIQESALDGLWYWDLENPENEWMNPKFWMVLGYNPDEMPHKSTAWQNIIHPDDLKVAIDNFTKHCENPNHPYDQIVRYEHKDGSTVWIRCRGLAIRDKDGKPIRMLGAHQDVTHHKKSEHELLKAKETVQVYEEKYRAFYDNAPLSYQSLDENGCFIDINPMWSKTLGYERDEVIGKWYGDFLHPEYVEHFRINFPAFKKRGYISDVQFQLRKKDNTFIYVSFEGCIGYTPDGKFRQTYCVFKDITQQKKLENELIKAKEIAVESEKKFRTYVENANDIIYQVTPEGVFTYVSPNWREFLGYPLDEVIGVHPDKFVHPEDLSLCMDFLNKVLTTGQKQSGVEYRVKHKNGTWRWHNSNGTPLKDEQGKVVSYLGVARDITDRKLQEKERLELHQRYQTILKNFPNGAVFLFDRNLKYIHVEGKVIDAVGLQPEKLIGKTVKEVFPPEVADIAYQNQMQLFEGKSCYYEVQFANRIFANWGEPVINHKSEIEEGIIFAVDITDLKNYEQEIIKQNDEYEALNEELRQTNEKLFFAIEKIEASETKYKAAFLTSPDSVNINKFNGEYVEINEGFTRLTGFTQEDVIGRLSSEIDIWAIPDDRKKLAEGLKKDGIVENLESLFRAKDGRLIPALMSAKLFYLNDEPHILSVTRDITEHKKSIAALQQIEWMLKEKPVQNESPTPEYGDLTEQNTSGLILSSVGKEHLIKIASEYLDLLETSSAIYEKNGDYALGLFSSSWCQMMDSASRKLCNTNSNEEALKSGKWHCHESCWRDASLAAIDSGRPADVKCKGGIRLFAVPIQANGKVIGAINFGYGNPPTADDELQDLAALYEVPIEELRKKRQEYQIRPQFIIDFAKRRIQLSAQYLGNLIERKQAERLIHEKSEEIATQNEELYQTNLQLFAAKQKAEESEQRYALAIDASEQGIWDWNLETGELFFSEQWKRQIGYEDHELKNDFDTWVEHLHPDEKEAHLKAVQAYLNNPGKHFYLEFRFRHKDGSYRWIHNKASSILNKEGKVVRMFGAHSDITDRKLFDLLLQEKSDEITAQNEELYQTNIELFNAKEKAEENEEKFRLLHENAGLGIGYYTPEGIVISFNVVAAGHMNGKPENFTGKSIFDLYPAENAEQYFNRIKNATLADAPTIYEDQVELPTENKWFLSTFTKILNSKNEITGIQIISQDITDQKKLQTELLRSKEKAEESQKKFKAIADTSPLAIYISKGIKQVAEYINPTFYNLFGYEYQEVSEVALWWPLAYPDVEYRKTKSEEWNRKAEVAIQNKTDIEPMETLVTCKDGTQKNILWGFVSTGDENWAFGMDLTDIRKTENDLIKAKENAVKSEEILRQVIDLVPHFIFAKDNQGCYILSNQALANAYGTTVENLLGKTDNDFTIPEIAEKYRSDDSEVIQSGIPKLVQEHLVDAEGNIQYVSTIKIPFTSLGNNLPAMLGVSINITEQYKAEQELIKAKENAIASEQHFKSLIENAPDGVVVMDGGGRFIYGSPNAARHFGYTEMEILGHSGDEFTHPDDMPIVLKTLETIFNAPSQKPTANYRFKQKNGEYRWIETTFTNLLSDKVINGIVLNFTDITDRKQMFEDLVIAKEKAEENEKKLIFHKNEIELNNNRLESLLKISQFQTNSLQELLDFALNEAVKLTNSKIGYIYFYNEESKQFILNTWSKEVMKECSVLNPQSVYDLDKTGCWGEAVRQRKPIIINDFQAENPLKRGTPQGHVALEKFLTIPVFIDNKIVAVAGVANKITDYDNADIRQLSLLMDSVWKISERIHLIKDLTNAKEKTEKSEERFNLAMKASNDGLFDWNLETNEIYYSPGWKKMLGYEERELPNDFSVWEKTTHPDDVMKSWELQQKLIKKEVDRFVIEFKMKHKNGHWVDILARAEAFFNDNGKAVRMVGTHTDISERKQAEKERQEKEELEKKIQLSEESLRFKQNFLANMSHEIRTPLTGILGMAEILSNTKLNTEQTDYLNTILISGENLREIINNVLDFSKIEAGKMQLKKKVFSLQSICGTAESLFTSTCKKPISFKCTIDHQLPAYINCDENRIKQIINNLISNAVKFTSMGEIHLMVHLQQYKPETKLLEIKISVSDTGVGIPEYLQEKLFRPFSQIDNRDIREFEGTGLGLSICKNLVALLGGEIGVQSSPDKGSTFWFTFTAEEAIHIADSTANADPGRSSRKNPLKLRILLAEDKLVNQKVIKLQLNSMGHEVTIVDNGEKAVETFDPAKFDLILMDIQMPIMDGITAAQTLKKTFNNLPPIIGLSANAFEGDREKYLVLGMDEYLTKPFVVADFVRLVDELFGAKEGS